MNILWYDTINVRKGVKESLNFVYKEISVVIKCWSLLLLEFCAQADHQWTADHLQWSPSTCCCCSQGLQVLCWVTEGSGLQLQFFAHSLGSWRLHTRLACPAPPQRCLYSSEVWAPRGWFVPVVCLCPAQESLFLVQACGRVKHFLLWYLLNFQSSTAGQQEAARHKAHTPCFHLYWILQNCSCGWGPHCLHPSAWQRLWCAGTTHHRRVPVYELGTKMGSRKRAPLWRRTESPGLISEGEIWQKPQQWPC